MLKTLIATRASAYEFVFAALALATGGATSADIIHGSRALHAKYTANAVHSALHRLYATGLIERSGRSKGAAYRLTAAGLLRWANALREQPVA